MSEIPQPPASVLVVDDTIENLRLLSNMLTGRGYEVRPVTNGAQALKAAESDPPDLVLLDIGMPEMDGYEVCRLLKAQERLKDVPVIFLTALTDTADKVRAFETGGVDYVTKPFQIEEVLARVKTHVALRRAQLALTESYSRLRGMERLRDDLVHMVIHDMRSPLQALLSYLALFERSAGALSQDCRENLDAAVESAGALRRMANDVIDVSRLEHGGMPLERAKWNLTRMAEDVCGAFRSMDRGREIEVDGPVTVEAFCDGALVRRVVENLVGNAIKHTPAGAPLRISITGEHGRARVVVHDRGPGVPAEARATIFEKFGTVVNRRSETYHSAGLGLAFCKLAIEAHGGTIGMDPGVPTGSAFWFELPG